MDIKYKNVVLLVCGSHYGYQKNAGTKHGQLLRWYYNIYGESRQYRLLSGFSVKNNGSLVFNDWPRNEMGLYTYNINKMKPFEEDAIQRVINGELHSYMAS